MGYSVLAGQANIVLFGCGKEGKWVLEELRRRAIPVRYFCDNDPKLWGQRWKGVEIVAPHSLKSMEAAIFISANQQNFGEIQAQLAEMNLAAVNS